MRFVYSIALRIVKDVPTAEEVVQETFVQLWLRWARYDSALGPILPWLSALARNKALDHVRSLAERQRQVEKPCTDLLDSFGCLGPGFVPQETMLTARALAALSSLRPNERAAIELAYFEDLTHSEIAEILDAPLGSVKSWIRAGLLRMRKVLLTTASAKGRPMTSPFVKTLCRTLVHV